MHMFWTMLLRYSFILQQVKDLIGDIMFGETSSFSRKITSISSRTSFYLVLGPSNPGDGLGWDMIQRRNKSFMIFCAILNFLISMVQTGQLQALKPLHTRDVVI